LLPFPDDPLELLPFPDDPFELFPFPDDPLELELELLPIPDDPFELLLPFPDDPLFEPEPDAELPWDPEPELPLDPEELELFPFEALLKSFLKVLERVERLFELIFGASGDERTSGSTVIRTATTCEEVAAGGLLVATVCTVGTEATEVLNRT